MSDDTRPFDPSAPHSHSDRTSPASWPAVPTNENLGSRIELLTHQGTSLLALALPWTEAVADVLAEYEDAVTPLRLDDQTHRRVADAVGVTELYDQLDTLPTAASNIFDG